MSTSACGVISAHLKVTVCSAWRHTWPALIWIRQVAASCEQLRTFAGLPNMKKHAGTRPVAIMEKPCLRCSTVPTMMKFCHSDSRSKVVNQSNSVQAHLAVQLQLCVQASVVHIQGFAASVTLSCLRVRIRRGDDLFSGRSGRKSTASHSPEGVLRCQVQLRNAVLPAP